MITNIQKDVIVRALQNRKISANEEPEDVLKTYKNLSEEEKQDILALYQERTK